MKSVSEVFTSLSDRIRLDRFAQKDRDKLPQPGDVAVTKIGKEVEICKVDSVEADSDLVHLTSFRTGQSVVCKISCVDLPIELTEEELWSRVAKGCANTLDEEHSFFEAMQDWKFVPAGRILAGCGTPVKVTYNNCFVIASPEDSREGIIRKSLGDFMEIMSRGGGVGINMSSLRPRNALVRGVNGRSSGVVSWMDLFSKGVELISQGGSRKGASMLLLNDWHPDILEFIDAKRTPGVLEGANISVGFSEEFMKALERGYSWDLRFPPTDHPAYAEEWKGNLEDWEAKGYPTVVYRTIPAQELWERVVRSAWASAEPGLWFRGRCQERSNAWYDPNGVILACNPCQPSWATVATPHGIRQIADVNVGDVIWGGHDWVRITRKVCTGNKEVLAYCTRAGIFFGTENHRIIQCGEKVKVSQATGIDISVVDCDVASSLSWDPQDVMDGLVFGDGWSKRFSSEKSKKYDRVLLCVGAGDTCYFESEVSPLFKGMYDQSYKVETTLTLDEVVKTYERKVPDRFRYGPLGKVCGFLRGLYSANGSIVANRITLKAFSFKVIVAVQEMLSLAGIRSYYTVNKSRVCEFSNGDYMMKESYDLNIGTREGRTRFFNLIGFIHPDKTDRLKATLSQFIGKQQSKQTFEIVEISSLGAEPVYSLTVDSEEHTYWTSGLLVANCSEIPLPAYGVCLLGHINLAKMVRGPIGSAEVCWDLLAKTIKTAVRFLDNTIDKTYYPIPEIEERQLSERRIGLGTLGLAEALIRCGIRYGSSESIQWIDDVYNMIANTAYETSALLAHEKGSFASLDREKFLQADLPSRLSMGVRELIFEFGIRNVCLLTAAPCGTVGTMIGTSTGIEPFYQFVWKRQGGFGESIDRSAVVDEYRELVGDGELPDYFVTAMDLSPEEHVSVQAACQKWIEQSISKSINCPANWTPEQIGAVYKLLYTSGCKGGTVYREGSRDKQVLSMISEKTEMPAKVSSNGKKSAKASVQKRPYKRHGVTVSEESPAGTIHITMNEVDGDPFEIFLELGKAGSEVKAMAEALGRLGSLILRLPSELSKHDRIRAMVEQLRGIKGDESVGMGPNRVGSLPDGFAKAMSEHWLEGEQLQPSRDVCPDCGCATLIRTSGCVECRCGYSKCS